MRVAVRRREDQVEQEEIESGELNLIPYLDMVTNLMLFLLASVAAGIIFTQIDTQLPDKAPPSSAAAPANPNPDEQPLKMVVSVTRDRLILWSISGLEGTLQAPKAVFPRTGRDGEPCDGAYMCESGYCSDQRQCGAAPKPQTPPAPTPVFDFRGLSESLFEIANRRYAGKPRKQDTYQIILMADGAIPYNTIASTMAAMRCRAPAFGKEPTACALPTDDPELRKAENPVSPDKTLYDTTRAPYDPKTMSLFSDILFSLGFE